MSVNPRRRNHAIWIGPALTFIGAVTYFTVFARFAVTRDFPWVSLPLVLAGVALSALGLWRAWRRPSLFRGRRLGTLGLTASLLLGGSFVFYVFFFSYRLPDPTPMSSVLGEPQDFSLTDQRGRRFSLRELRGHKVVLVFYRGFW